VAKRLNKEIKDSHILDQYGNPSNPLAHYDETAEEILDQCEGRVDVCVVSAGTGGTIAGIGRKLKERCPNCKIIGVDPVGSILALPNTLNGKISSYKVEGIGYDFIPNVLDRYVVDEWFKTEDKESLTMARRLIKEEGLLCGGSSGAAMVAALQVAKTMKAGQRLVVILPDSVRNYMSKFLNDQWMIDNGSMEDTTETKAEWWSQKTVADLRLSTPFTCAPDVSCKKCIDILRTNGYDQLPVVSKDQAVLGMVTLGNLTSQITTGRVKNDDPVSKALYKQFKQVSGTTTLAALSKIFMRDHFALCVTTQKNFTVSGSVEETSVVTGVVTPIDLLNYITSGPK